MRLLPPRVASPRADLADTLRRTECPERVVALFATLGPRAVVLTPAWAFPVLWTERATPTPVTFDALVALAHITREERAALPHAIAVVGLGAVRRDLADLSRHYREELTGFPPGFRPIVGVGARKIGYGGPDADV